MSDVALQILGELKRIRECLEGSQPLGFGKKKVPVYIFVKLVQEGPLTYLWYSRNKSEGQNVPITERDLTGYLVNVWLYERSDAVTGERVPKLNVYLHADRDYLIQTGIQTNFSRSFLAGLLELEPGALKEPVTLVVEDNLDTHQRGRPTVFCRVESRGVRMTPVFDRSTSHESLYQQVVAKFGFIDPYLPGAADAGVKTGGVATGRVNGG
jgi:hypothetical protein